MELSIVVNFHNMRREAARTLHSLSPAYQTGAPSDYEVIAIDNGSRTPLDPAEVAAFGPNFRYHYFATDAVSPGEAVNYGAAIARGDLIAVIVDGARMATPGLVGQSIAAARHFAEPFVVALAWHLGPKMQQISVAEGYDQVEEDRLLAEIDWRANGYDLFTIAAAAASQQGGFLAGIPRECSWFCMRRATFLRLGGLDTRFRAPGGGLINQDFRERALALPGLSPVVLLGEGVFHQIHGGVSTNVPMAKHPIDRFRAEYREIRGVDFESTPSPPTFCYGSLPEQARRFLGQSGPRKQRPAR